MGKINFINTSITEITNIFLQQQTKVALNVKMFINDVYHWYILFLNENLHENNNVMYLHFPTKIRRVLFWSKNTILSLSPKCKLNSIHYFIYFQLILIYRHRLYYPSDSYIDATVSEKRLPLFSAEILPFNIANICIRK